MVGLYLGLSEIRRRDPDALVAVFPAAHRLIVLDPQDVTWSDWGRPERIQRIQAVLGATGVTAPALPLRVPA